MSMPTMRLIGDFTWLGVNLSTQIVCVIITHGITVFSIALGEKKKNIFSKLTIARLVKAIWLYLQGFIGVFEINAYQLVILLS